MICFFLVTRSNSFIKKRFRKKRCTYSRIIFNEVNFNWKLIINIFVFFFLRDTSKYENFETAKYEALVGQERSAFEAAKRELDQCKTKVEGLTHDVKIFLWNYFSWNFIL